MVIKGAVIKPFPLRDEEVPAPFYSLGLGDAQGPMFHSQGQHVVSADSNRSGWTGRGAGERCDSKQRAAVVVTSPSEHKAAPRTHGLAVVTVVAADPGASPSAWHVTGPPVWAE